MKIACTLILITAGILCTSCQSSYLPPVSSIRPGIAKEGSFANQKLISDATEGCLQAMKQLGYNRPSYPAPLAFVIQKPRGKTGERAWREMWQFKTKTGYDSFIMTFRETGLGSASFEIEPNAEQIK